MLSAVAKHGKRGQLFRLLIKEKQTRLVSNYIIAKSIYR
jgi:hypothetical protein